ncbi:YdcF family protein [Candidatus Woesearchaeota archaeon]|nr:YdcF family protein [Candidatus Woesearchaeota archaeon]
MYDTIIVLGHSAPDEKITETGKRRVEKAVETFKKYHPKYIIMSGSHSGLTEKPKLTEAEIFKRYAIKLKIPKNKILKEEQSKDTIGNAFFSKKLLKKHNLKSPIIICSPEGCYRVKKTFNIIFGNNFKLKFIKASSAQSLLGRIKNIFTELLILRKVNKYFSLVKPGDDKTIEKMLFTQHPFYKK